MTELLKAVDKIGESFDGFKQTTGKSLEKIGQRIDGLQERVEISESTQGRPEKYSGGAFSKDQSEYKTTFLDWMRHSRDKVYEVRLAEAQHELGKKDVSIGVNAAGGFALPEEISRAIENRERQLNPFRQLVRVETCSTNDYKALVSLGDGTSGWVSETGTRSATLSPNLRERAPTFGEQYALPTTTEWALDDIFFNVQEWLVNEVAADWAAQEATAIISGDGSSKPTGILATTPVVTDDDASPLRAAGVIEYIPLTSPASPQVINFDSLIDLVSQVKEKYLMESDGVAFVMHRLTAAKVRKLKASGTGDYVWQDSTQAGMPASLLGYRVFTCDAMPTAGGNNFAVLFGNFRRGYLLVDRVGIRVTPNPYSTPGKVSFYVRRRLGGCVLLNDAIKALRIED